MAKRRVEQEEWEALWRGICELSGFFPEGIVFIGGIAVYLYASGAKIPESWIEFSHDGDFYISLSDFADLRDIEEVTTNRRLSKHQIIKDRIYFDVYLEHHNKLRIPYESIVSASKVLENVRVASLEHLLLLKLDAYASRLHSAKGRKDERDLIRIAHILAKRGTHKNLLATHITAQDVERMNDMTRSTEFMSFSRIPKQIATLRSEFMDVLNIVQELFET